MTTGRNTNEMKDIKDYIHLYIGGKVSVTNLEGRVVVLLDYDFLHSYYDEDNGEFLNDPKPILRRLSDMSEEDSRKIFGTKTKHLFYKKEEERDPAGLFLFTPNEFKKLCEESFDLFGLIDAGLAIDEKTLTN